MPPSVDQPEGAVPLTRTEWANHRLRRAILSGELLPGQKLIATALAAEWHVSPTPLREAFVRLAETGLVELTPQRGARVAALSLDEAIEIFELRLHLEPVALRESFARSDKAHADAVAAQLHELQRTLDLGALDETVVAHSRFHVALIDRASGTWLKRFCETLSAHSGRYQMLSPFGDDETAARMQEHRAILEALRDGRIDTAVDFLVEHLEQSLVRIRAWSEAGESDRSASLHLIR